MKARFLLITHKKTQNTFFLLLDMGTRETWSAMDVCAMVLDPTHSQIPLSIVQMLSFLLAFVGCKGLLFLFFFFSTAIVLFSPTMMARRELVDRKMCKTMRRNNAERVVFCYTRESPTRDNAENQQQSVIVQRCNGMLKFIWRRHGKRTALAPCARVEYLPSSVTWRRTDFARQHFFSAANKSEWVGSLWSRFFFFSSANTFIALFPLLWLRDKWKNKLWMNERDHSSTTIGEARMDCRGLLWWLLRQSLIGRIRSIFENYCD